MVIEYRKLVKLWTSLAVITLICGLCRFCQTAEVGELRLADGPSPNMGRVEIYLGTRGWFTTCDPTWDINDAIVVCRQLGFPGAAFARPESTYGRARGIPLSRTVECTGYESRLLDCPYHTTRLCTSAVGVVCQEPGYVGCYADEPSDSMFRGGHSQSRVMDLNECRAFCRTKRARFIGLKNTQECYCGRTGKSLPTHEKLKDSECQMPCAGNPDEICGGVSTKGNYVVSVHKMNTGECAPLSNPTNGYLLDTDFTYGEVVRFKCLSGYTLVGSKAVRCVLRRVQSDLGPNVVWNASAPVCEVRAASPVADDRVWLPTRGTTGKNPDYEKGTEIPPLLVVTEDMFSTTHIATNAKASFTKVLADKPGLVLVVVLIVVLAVLVPACIVVILRRHYARRKILVENGMEKHSYQDLVYNQNYEPNPATYEPLRPPRKRDVLRQNGRSPNRTPNRTPTQTPVRTPPDTPLPTPTHTPTSTLATYSWRLYQLNPEYMESPVHMESPEYMESPVQNTTNEDRHYKNVVEPTYSVAL